jgi:superfamily II DNA or RNA helicase
MIKAMKKVIFQRRIGLSATPYRQFDMIGNKSINNFFGIKDGYTFEYSMAEAIKNGVLSKYRYFPHIVNLNADEMEQYLVLSKQIAKFFHADTNTFDDDPILTALLLKRKRIIHKAVNKLVKFKEIINDLYKDKGSLKYTMVYAPEGVCPDESYYTVIDDRDEIDEISEDTPLIDLYTMLVAETDKYTTVEQFTSRETDRDRILQDFANGITEVLVAMKCLDEGVDVPRAENAIFCASTGNPRQFIQRRGRILRTHDEKPMAYIHDLVVVPYVDYDTESFKMERSLLKRELQRVSDFAQLASNSSYTENVLEDIIEYYELNLYEHEQD